MRVKSQAFNIEGAVRDDNRYTCAHFVTRERDAINGYVENAGKRWPITAARAALSLYTPFKPLNSLINFGSNLRLRLPSTGP